MGTATAKDLRQRTSALLDTVRRGQEVVITYRGKRIAVLAPLNQTADEELRRAPRFPQDTADASRVQARSLLQHKPPRGGASTGGGPWAPPSRPLSGYHVRWAHPDPDVAQALEEVVEHLVHGAAAVQRHLILKNPELDTQVFESFSDRVLF
jgi:prevent-host-death family protein